MHSSGKENGLFIKRHNFYDNHILGFTPLSASFSQLVNNKMFSDVEIVIDGLTFYAHKAILAKRSLFFKSIFVDGQVPTLVKTFPTHYQHFCLLYMNEKEYGNFSFPCY